MATNSSAGGTGRPDARRIEKMRALLMGMTVEQRYLFLAKYALRYHDWKRAKGGGRGSEPGAVG
mgnify:CR=1 FL=1